MIQNHGDLSLFISKHTIQYGKEGQNLKKQIFFHTNQQVKKLAQGLNSINQVREIQKLEPKHRTY